MSTIRAPARAAGTIAFSPARPRVRSSLRRRRRRQPGGTGRVVGHEALAIARWVGRSLGAKLARRSACSLTSAWSPVRSSAESRGHPAPFDSERAFSAPAWKAAVREANDSVAARVMRMPCSTKDRSFNDQFAREPKRRDPAPSRWTGYGGRFSAMDISTSEIRRTRHPAGRPRSVPGPGLAPAPRRRIVTGVGAMAAMPRRRTRQEEGEL